MDTLQKPSDETLQQIDFVIQGLENGKFKQLAKEVEFHQKLKGDDDPTYFAGLWKLIEMQQDRIQSLEVDLGQYHSKQITFDNRIDELENMLNDYKANMRSIANGLLMVGRPDPFDQDYTTAPHKHDAETFVTTWKAKF